MDTARETSCSLCPDKALDRLGNHAATCKRGGDVVSRHNHLRDLMLEFCRHAHQVVRVEKGSGLTPDHSCTRPADILALDWDRERHATFDVTVITPLSVSILPEASMSVAGQGRILTVVGPGQLALWAPSPNVSGVRGGPPCNTSGKALVIVQIHVRAGGGGGGGGAFVVVIIQARGGGGP